jgi:branched-chain amino acid transport system ATP-binding protein
MGSPSTDIILDIRDAKFAYGGVLAVDGCSFHAARNSVTGLIGPNGAGKSTLIDLVSGGLRPLSGEIVFEGENIAGMSRAAIARKGLIRTFQISRELARLPIIENVMLAAPSQVGENPLLALARRGKWWPQERELRARALELLGWVQLDRMVEEPAYALSGGQRRLLDIARALMARPRMLLLDEPTAGVYPALTLLIADRIREIPSLGVTVLLVAHNLSFIARVCDEVVVMSHGRPLTRGSLDEVRANQEVVRAYLGE